ncbi:MAG: 3-isopropylmalate dehydratase small subunit [Gammaproteobacteria bacterium]|nr:3-isopropylmalate dehydratase small subunit [Gammaproteobacteria bacterium]
MSDQKISRIDGTAIAIRGNDIDTDRILPARYLKLLTFADMGKYPFYDVRHDADGKLTDHPFNGPTAKTARIMFVNSNFGCGSSREHAPQALKRWGIEAIVGVSYGEIFAGNCERIGMPAARVSPEDAKRLQDAAEAEPGVEWTLDLDQMVISGANLRIPVELPENRRKALLDGHWDTTGVLLENVDKTREVYERLPYTHGYR